VARKDKTQINGILSPLLQRIRFRKAVPHIRGKGILDVGCSNGEILDHLPEGIDFIGIEGNPSYFEKARLDHPGQRFLNLYLDRDNSKGLDISGRDTIVMLAVLEHLKDPVEILHNLGAYLADGGRIVITTPTNRAEIILKVGSRVRLFSSEMDEHEDHFSRKRLFEICRAAGYRIVHYSTFEMGLNHLIVLEPNQHRKPGDDR